MEDLLEVQAPEVQGPDVARSDSRAGPPPLDIPSPRMGAGGYDPDEFEDAPDKIEADLPPRALVLANQRGHWRTGGGGGRPRPYGYYGLQPVKTQARGADLQPALHL